MLLEIDWRIWQSQRTHRDYIDRALIEYAAASYHFDLEGIARTLRMSKPISDFSTSKSIASMKQPNI